jgi:hypothetical protein
MIQILANDGLNDQPIASQAFVDDLRRHRSTGYASFGQCWQARFSRLVTRTKYLAGSTSGCSELS